MLDRLESAFAAQRQFLDDAGHELRTPITIVRGHLELMGDDPAEREETMALVMDELDRMARIVNDVMVLARSERPDFLNYEAVDVAALTQEVAAKAQALAPRRWSVERAGRGVIVADRQRLTQALVQLAQNAVQHTGEGDAIILASSVADGRARFTVRDTGPGVPVQERERVFERFARGSGERRARGPASASRSSARSPRATAAASSSPSTPTAAPSSPSTSRSTRRPRRRPEEVRHEQHPDRRGRGAHRLVRGEGPAVQRLRDGGRGRTASPAWRWPRAAGSTWWCSTSASRTSTASRC